MERYEENQGSSDDAKLLKFPTPSLGKEIDFELVYEPAEDTFLMLDALEAEIEELRRLRPTLCIEIGSGSGLNLTFLSKILNMPTASMGIDINPFANEATLSTGKANQIEIEAIRTSLCGGLRLEGKVDVLIFNPPYVPTEEVVKDPHVLEGDLDQCIVASWAGGERGRYWIDRLLSHVNGLLSKDGRFYMVAVAENDPVEIRKIALKCFDLKSEIVISRKARNEHLFIIKFYK